MLDKLLNPFALPSVEHFYKQFGVDITPSKPNEEPNAHIRMGKEMVLYGFKLYEDYIKFKKVLQDNGIKYDFSESTGARYPFNLVIKNNPIAEAIFKPSNYTQETLLEAIQAIQKAKTITIKAQDYTSSALLRDAEKRLIAEAEKFPQEPSKRAEPITKEDIDHLTWMYNRLANQWKENPMVDYMVKMNDIIHKFNTNNNG